MNYFLKFLILVTLISCSKKDTAEEILPLKLKVEFQYVRPSAFGKSDGQIIKRIAGGVGPYTIEWLTDGYNFPVNITINENQDLINISSGPYIIKVYDSNNMLLIDTAFLASNDTIISSPYICAYPGSYWIYSNGDSIFCKDYTKTPYNGYYRILEWNYYGPNLPEDSIYLPEARWKIFNNGIYYYHEKGGSLESGQLDDPAGEITVLVSDELNREFYESDDRIEASRLKVVAIDTSIVIGENIYNNVVIMEFRSGPPSASFDDMNGSIKTYYSKNIGLIKGAGYEIVEYYINFSNQ